MYRKIQQIIGLRKESVDMLYKGNYEKALKKIENYLPMQKLLLDSNPSFKVKNEINLINAYFDQIQCIINVNLNLDSISRIPYILTSAWRTDTSNDKRKFKHGVYRLENRLKDSKKDMLLYYLVCYPFNSIEKHSTYYNKLGKFLSDQPDILEVLYESFIENNKADVFHFIPFCYHFQNYYQNRKDYDKCIKIAEVFSEKLFDLKTKEEFKALNSDIEHLIPNMKQLRLYYLKHYDWLFDAYVNKGNYESAKRVLKEARRETDKEINREEQTDEENGQKKSLKSLEYRLKANSVKSGILALLERDLDKAIKNFDEILKETTYYDNSRATQESIAGKICILLYREEDAIEFANSYRFLKIKKHEREKFIKRISWLCNLFSNEISSPDKQNKFRGNYLTFLKYYELGIDKKENSILMANAQLGLWTNIMLHQLKQYLPGASLLLDEISELLEKSEVPKELLKIIKGLDDNYKKISSLVSLFRERMDPTHNISIKSIEGSYFNNVENILPLSYLKAGFTLDIHTKNNLPDNFHFFSEIYYIEHVLMNLIKNAAEAIEEKQKRVKGLQGKITISIEYIDSSDEIKFLVEDNGPGFPEETDLDSVKLFHSTKDGNIRGLGIHICKMFVETLGGNISHESKEAVGSKISFCIPARRKGEANEI